METCSIPFMFFKSILWMDLRELLHDMVSADLCQDGGCLDLGNKCISAYDILERFLFYILESVVISTIYLDELIGVSYLSKYLPEGFVHCEPIRLTYPDLIDNLRRYDPDSTETVSLCDGCMDHGENRFPFLR